MACCDSDKSSGSGSDSGGLPETMQRKPKKAKRQRGPPTAGKAEGGPLRSPPPAAAVPPPQKQQSSAPPSALPQERQPGNAGEGASEKKQRPSNKNKNKKKLQSTTADDDDDEALLDALCHDNEKGGNGGARAAAAGGEGAPSPPPSAEVWEALLVCDTAHLDPRVERAKSFGRAAVAAQQSANPHQFNGIFAQMLAHAQQQRVATFRHSPFVAPDNTCWPPFASLGLRALLLNPTATSEKGGGSKPKKKTGPAGSTASLAHHGPARYALDDEAPQQKAAQRAFARVAAAFGGMEALIDVAQRQPYHLPTLLQLAVAFQTTGDVPASRQMADMALYALGQALTASGFPLAAPATRRLLPRDASDLNAAAFAVLAASVHGAFKAGCPRTALERALLLRSCDPLCAPALAATACLDSLAVRAGRWQWLLDVDVATTVHLRALAIAAAADDVDGSSAEQQRSSAPGDNATADVAIDIAGAARAARKALFDAIAKAPQSLPSWPFNTALATYFLAQRSNSSSSVGDAAAAAEGDAVASLRVAEARLDAAIRLWPSYAAQLAEKAGASLADEPWCRLASSSDELLASARHVAALGIDRSHELWKPPTVMAFFKAAVARQVGHGSGDALADRREAPLSSPFVFAAFAEARGLCVAQAHERYSVVSLDDVSGAHAAAIPAELLAPVDDDGDEQLWRGGGVGVGRAARAEGPHRAFGDDGGGGDDGLLEALARMRAVFGDDVSPEVTQLPQVDQLRYFEAQIAQHMAAVGEAHSPLALFLRSLLPFGPSVRELALQQAMAQRGVEDPAVLARRAAAAADQASYEYDARVTAEEEARAEEAEESGDEN